MRIDYFFQAGGTVNVFSLKKANGGPAKKKNARQNAAELRVQKGNRLID
jgi:hypothetical protein